MQKVNVKNGISRLMYLVFSGYLILAVSGLTLNIHFCHQSRSGFSFYPEITRNFASCGCEKGEQTAFRVSKELKTGISKKSCCNNFHYYQKVHTPSFERILLLGNVLASDISLPQLLPGIEMPVISVRSILQQTDDPAPPSGKKLVYLLHQPRIPSSIGDC